MWPRSRSVKKVQTRSGGCLVEDRFVKLLLLETVVRDYLRALLANDLGAQFAALSTWLASPGEKARSIREALLYVYNFEVSSPRIHDTVNPAFHLIEPSVRQQIATGFASRARNERIDLASYWDSLLNFWMKQ